MNTGNNPRWTWEQYQEETGIPRSEAEQRDAIIGAVDQLFSQGDYWSLNAVLALLGRLAEAEDHDGYNILSILHGLVDLNPRSLELTSSWVSAFRRH